MSFASYRSAIPPAPSARARRSASRSAKYSAATATANLLHDDRPQRGPRRWCPATDTRPAARECHHTGAPARPLDDARDDDAVRAVVLTGHGRFFSAGLDLRGGIDFQALSSTGTPTDPFLRLSSCLLNFLRFPKPSVAMLRGHAIAGGLILLLACDYRLGLEGDYRIGLNQVAIGASFPKAAFEIVGLRLTHQQATELLLGAALYPAG